MPNYIPNYPYPTVATTAKYASLGGMIGSFVILASIALLVVAKMVMEAIIGVGNGTLVGAFSFEQVSISKLISTGFSLLGAILMTIVIGMMIGFVPALITGFTISKFKIYRSTKGLLTAFIVGFLVTALVMSIVVVIILFINDDLDASLFSISSIMTLCMSGLLGGSSALLLGRWVLPEQPSYHFNLAHNS